MSRSRSAATLMSVRRCPVIERHGPAASWRRAWLLFGLLLVGVLLVAVVAPAHGFDGEPGSQESAQDLVFYGSGVPTAANWVVLDASGTAAWRAEGETHWHRFTRGEVLPAGCEIETGSDGEIVLVAGGDQLTIAPRGRLIVPFARPGQDRRLRQERGRILMQIESRDARDVRVNTPLLSLGIKGTKFEVAVDPEQNSVLVHEGEVEVTTPGRPDAVDVGAGEGLRQPAVPGSEATRFTLPVPESPAGSADEPVWLLPPAATNGAEEPETFGPASQAAPAEARTQADSAHGGSAQTQPSSSHAETEFGWLDELASSWGSVAIAAVALLILTIPLLALLQNLREQWLGRPGAKGQRRRQMVRG